ncbi:MAG TPA: glycosyltransferase [Syntrophorhabdaceae bacterium]|nr:glycosyltransferase [Syntrophorhabdaceae bacterium]
MKPGDSVVVFCMDQRGHTKRLTPVVSGLSLAGIHVHVFTSQRFSKDIVEAGGLYIDLYDGRRLDEADPSSTPNPCRYVSFAGYYAEQILSDVAALKPSLVLHDGFAVIGQVVAQALGIPRVNICAGHNREPQAALKALIDDPIVNISENCRNAVKTLRDKYGIKNASPFSYITAISKDLNVYCEPPQYLSEDQREPFEPIAFFGSLSENAISRPPSGSSLYCKHAGVKQRIFVSMGTLIWRHYEATARNLLEAIREATEGLPEYSVLVSLGGAAAGNWVRRLEASNFRVELYVDQWSVLSTSTVFITHQGLNSTHEAVFHRVPMISYPFLADQPAMAKCCQDMGIAVPLSVELRGIVSADDVLSALLKVDERRNAMLERLSEARQWELDVIARRGDVIRRIMDLVP